MPLTAIFAPINSKTESQGYSLKTYKSNQPGPENNILIKRIGCNNLTNELLILTLGLKGGNLGRGLHRLDCIYCWELPGEQRTNRWISSASLGVLPLKCLAISIFVSEWFLASMSSGHKSFFITCPFFKCCLFSITLMPIITESYWTTIWNFNFKS